MSTKSQALLLAMVLVLTVSQGNPYCSSFDSNNVCIACYQGYFINPSIICTVGNAYCKTFTNDLTGNCASCWEGTHAGPTCAVVPSPPNPYCATLSGNTCTSCYQGYYINPSNICTFGNQHCKTYTTDGTGNCAQCWHFSRSGPTCGATVTPPTDPYCATWIGEIGSTCNTCYLGYFIINGKCSLPSGRNCATYTSEGYCATCVSGYIAAGQSCSAPISFCNAYNANGACTACVGGYQVNAAGACAIINQCPTPSANNVCDSCWAGYTLANGVCTRSSDPVDPYCSDFASDVCTSCNPGFYFNSAHVCTVGDHNCYIFRADGTGSCATCYFGAPVGGVCQSVDPQCLAYNLYGCVLCSTGFTVGHIGTCVPFIPRCYNYAADNSCTACFPGEILSAGACVPIPITDPYCTAYNGSQCTACQPAMYIRADNGKCEIANADCATYSLNGGDCLSCQWPLHLSSGFSPVLCVLWPRQQ